MSGESCPIVPEKAISDEEITRRRKICAECPDHSPPPPAFGSSLRCKFCGCSIEGLVKRAKQCRNAAAPRW